jgi:hypothetical protein
MTGRLERLELAWVGFGVVRGGAPLGEGIYRRLCERESCRDTEERMGNTAPGG